MDTNWPAPTSTAKHPSQLFYFVQTYYFKHLNLLYNTSIIPATNPPPLPTTPEHPHLSTPHHRTSTAHAKTSHTNGPSSPCAPRTPQKKTKKQNGRPPHRSCKPYPGFTKASARVLCLTT
ncbi:hypothetical protein BDW02DRAFT_572983 [Decorospora gaudefroyi]|uniref:Uncharacterized protein n=1 Tax=Decorospora gaudefroyi TaxID=184978 RepID=A0A6A5K7K5_9PLEO|nr:hypothetical protein BDW02DRAFT_572983 [Decorospora gaudefroyi]